MAEPTQELAAVGTGDYRIMEENGVRYRVYPGGERRRLKPRPKVDDTVVNMPVKNYRCIVPQSAQSPSECGDFYLDPKNPATKFVCPKCGTPTIMPLF